MAPCSRRALLTVLAEHGPLEVTTLAATLETHPLTVDQACAELHAAGYVQQVAGGVYDITETGDASLTQRADLDHRG